MIDLQQTSHNERVQDDTFWHMYTTNTSIKLMSISIISKVSMCLSVILSLYSSPPTYFTSWQLLIYFLSFYIFWNLILFKSYRKCFFVLLPELNIIILRIIHVAACINSLFFFICCAVLHCIHIHFAYLFTWWTFRLSPILAITHKAALNFCVWVFMYGHMFPFLLGKYLEVEWLEEVVIVWLTFK